MARTKQKMGGYGNTNKAGKSDKTIRDKTIRRASGAESATTGKGPKLGRGLKRKK